MFVDREFFLFFQVIDENFSWYLDENIHLYVKNASAVDKGDEAFRHGNLMHSVNGRVFGNLQGLDMCEGDRVSWHVFGLGGSHDLHGIAFEGNSLRINKQDLDTLVLAPGTSFTGYMYPDNPGTWAVFCHTFHHLMAGMSAQYTVRKCPMASKQTTQFSQSGIVRKYYIAAEEIDWNYAPSMRDLIENESLEDPKLRGYLYVRNDSGYIGPIYKKAVYREYTDETFSAQKQRIPEEEHLQLLGPFIRAEIGDVIEVVFMNKATHPFSIKPHGVFYDKSNEGMKYNDFSRDSETFDDAVPPGGSYTYRWTVPERSGPKPNETACIGWIYHSGSNMIRDTSSGLMGPLITCKKGTLDANGKRKDNIIREFAVVFYIINENRSWYIRQSYERFAQQVQPLPDNFEASNEMNAINGLIFGNLKGLDMNENDMVAWYVLGLGSEDDFHTVHFHGHSYIHKTSRSHRGDVIEVFPGTYETVEMLADNAGTWLLHCHVTKHMMNGMEAVYTIHPKFSVPPISLSNHLPGPENENMGTLSKIVSDHLSRLHQFDGNMASARILPSKGSIQIRPVRVDHATNTRPFGQSHTHGELISKPSGLNTAFTKPEIRVIQSDATGIPMENVQGSIRGMPSNGQGLDTFTQPPTFPFQVMSNNEQWQSFLQRQPTNMQAANSVDFTNNPRNPNLNFQMSQLSAQLSQTQTQTQSDFPQNNVADGFNMNINLGNGNSQRFVLQPGETFMTRFRFKRGTNQRSKRNARKTSNNLIRLFQANPRHGPQTLSFSHTEIQHGSGGNKNILNQSNRDDIDSKYNYNPHINLHK